MVGDQSAEAAALFRACSECRRELEPDWQFCAHCATRLGTSCPRCGVPLPPAGSQRCGHCGLALPRTPQRRALALVTERTRVDIERLLPRLGLDMSFVTRVDQLSTIVETSCPAVLIVDTEERLRGVVDAVLHKPARRKEWQLLFDGNTCE